MQTYAIIRDDLVYNIVIADDENFFAVAYPDDIVIPVTEETGVAAIGVEFIDGKFMPIKPWNSWVFDPNVWSWIAPQPYPNDGGIYLWDESSLSWVTPVIE